MMRQEGESGDGGGRANGGYDCVVWLEKVEGNEPKAYSSVCSSYEDYCLCHFEW